MIQYQGHSAEGTVALASPNSVSLALLFDGSLGNHAGMMPVLRDPSGVYRSLVTQEPVTLTPHPEPPA